MSPGLLNPMAAALEAGHQLDGDDDNDDTSHAQDPRLSAPLASGGHGGFNIDDKYNAYQNDRTESQLSDAFFREIYGKHLAGGEKVGASIEVSAQPSVEIHGKARDHAPLAETEQRRSKISGQHSFVNHHASTPITTQVQPQQHQSHSFRPDQYPQTGREQPASALEDASSLTWLSRISVNNAARPPDTGQPLRPLNGANGEQKPQPANPDSRLRKHKGTMEYSQSPTQSNEGRSYDQYNDDDEDSPDLGSESPGHRTLYDNDTGVVKFDFPNDTDTQLIRRDSLTDPPEDLDSQPMTEWQPPSQSPGAPDVPDTSFSSSHHKKSVPPETPVAIQKPFGLESLDGTVLGASQLFNQTQYTSAVKAASPTSSRPSPLYINNDAISSNHAISSPIKDRFLRTSPVSHGAASSPVLLEPPSRASNSTSSQDHDKGASRRLGVPFSSELHVKPLKRNKLDPIDEYRSFHNSEAAKSGRRQSSNQEESDSDPEFTKSTRRRLARQKQSRAEKSLASITLPAPQVPTQSYSRSSSNDRPIQDAEEEDVEVPSTNRAKSKLNNNHSEPSPTLGLVDTDQLGPDTDSQETVADSQQPQNPVPRESAVLQSEDQPSSPPACPLNIISTQREAVLVADTIPETSPAGTAAAEYTRDFSRIKKPIPESSSMGASLPPLPSTEVPPGTNGSGVEGQIRREAEIVRDAVASSPFLPGLRSSPTVILASSQRMVTRSSRRTEQIDSPVILNLPPSSNASSRTSSLSSLSATPPRPSSPTPNTEHEVQEPLGNVSSPAVAKSQRRGRTSSSAPKQNLKTYSLSPRSTSRASSRLSRGSSADGPVKSPATRRQTESRLGVSNYRKSLRQTLAAPVSVHESITSVASKEKIFQGMTFAVTFQSKHRHEDDEHFKARVSHNKSLKDSIVKEGGVVLSDGFDALFRLDSFYNKSNTMSALSNSMSLTSPEMGFTALIADEHSRKAKYIQALALGLPCLAPRWITTCVAKRRLVDWSSYLLCAGQSSFLGEAIRSRSLPYYDPMTSKLREVIEQRPKLLEDTEVLVVLKRTTKVDSMPYLFLVQVLGATLTRVHTLDEARVVLTQRQEAGNPFQWVYVGDRLTDVDAVLYGDTVKEAKESQGTRKRKRAANKATIDANTSLATQATDDQSARPPKRVRTLNDELVVQSLILGRLIEEDEMPL